MPPIPAKRRGPGRPPLAAGGGRSGRSAGGRGGGGRSGRGGRGLLLRPPPRPAGVAGKTSIGGNPNLEQATSDSEESSEDLLGANNNNNDGSNNSLGKSCMTPLYPDVSIEQRYQMTTSSLTEYSSLPVLVLAAKKMLT